MNWRERKREHLLPVHETFSIPAVYLTHAAGIPVPVNIRLHQRPAVIEVQGEDGTGQIIDIADRVIFTVAEVANVVTSAFVILSDTEAYVTGPSRPEREGFVWVEVRTATKAELASLLSQVDTAGDEWRGIPPWSQQ
ncbi:hypothetical protein AGRO_3642 [Agrobacterium sp. ATCC 31749]|uniref:hypothetical protein n=1 Tax=unclassified Agrobacterium TaxID=2632611 RepID=UPI00020DB60C|nr:MULTISPECIES: hypothetical protein [unclassified Agrobacterium]EGL63573.1 hypothetical protein AGRO_3642 [Agrobacterium sp. ATCC 31749]QKW97114.1 hypothetical protein GSF67_08435 [Agrobacterium sp. CGMCC 11546]